MSTIEDFENAPAGATARCPDGTRAMDVDGPGDPCLWITTEGEWLNPSEMAERGYTLNPTAPTTAQGALDLAWDLAHEVKEGQIIPRGTQYLESYDSALREYTAAFDFEIRPGGAPLRTLGPLSDPDPEPNWLDAPAVLASMDECSWQKVWFRSAPGHWKCTCCGGDSHWSEFVDVTPLYPKGQES